MMGNDDRMCPAKPSPRVVVLTEKSRLLAVRTGSVAVGDSGLEPLTSTMSTWRSNQLS